MHRIAVLPGDGTGPEVVKEGLKVLEAAAEAAGFNFETETYDFGGDRFLRETRPVTKERASFWRQLVREHWAEKAGSLVFVTALWMAVVPGARPLERSFQVPVEVANLPPGVEVEEVTPAAVGVTLSGRRRDFYLFAPRFLRVTIDATLAAQGRRRFQVLGRDVRYPQALTLEDIAPDEVKISVRKAAPPEPAAP